MDWLVKNLEEHWAILCLIKNNDVIPLPGGVNNIIANYYTDTWEPKSSEIFRSNDSECKSETDNSKSFLVKTINKNVIKWDANTLTVRCKICAFARDDCLIIKSASLNVQSLPFITSTSQEFNEVNETKVGSLSSSKSVQTWSQEFSEANETKVGGLSEFNKVDEEFVVTNICNLCLSKTTLEKIGLKDYVAVPWDRNDCIYVTEFGNYLCSLTGVNLIIKKK